MMISLSKKDVFWSYFAQIFNMASGLFILPVVLRLLTTAEISLNYILISLGAMVALFDFGFAPQFGRNIAYVFSGAQELHKSGIETAKITGQTNYQLLVTMIDTAKYIYLRIAIVVSIFLITFGTWYIYNVTDGFTSVDHAVWIWLTTITSIFFGFYFAYFDSLLLGRGLIKEAKKSMVFSKVAFIILAVTFLFFGFGLLGVAISNLIASFVYRFISYKFFYDSAFLAKISGIKVSFQDKKILFRKIWHNSSKLGLVLISAYAINNFSMFLAGIYLDHAEIASFGLLIQLVGIISTLSGTLFTSYNPTFSALRVSGNVNKLIRVFAFSMNIYYILFFIGASSLIFIGPHILDFIGSNAVLPSTIIILLYCTVVFLENNHSNFATLIVTKNEVPFFKSSLIAGAIVALADYLILSHTQLGVLGLIMVQGIVQLSYANWKWPSLVCKEFDISFVYFLKRGFLESAEKIKNQVCQH